MAAKGYTNKTNIENYIYQEIDDTYNTQIDAWIAAVERIIDSITGRNFKADETATARLYDGDETNELIIDECIQVTVVEVGTDSIGSTFTTIPSTGSGRYFTYPANALAKGVAINQIALSDRCFPGGMQNNRITAKWGYSATPPEDITFVATVFVAGIINQERQGGSEIKSETIGNYSVSYNSDKGDNSWADFARAKEILAQLTLLRI